MIKMLGLLKIYSISKYFNLVDNVKGGAIILLDILTKNRLHKF